MKSFPQTENPLVLRTEFSDPTAWAAICAEVQKPVGIFRFRANVEFLDDVQYTGIAKEQLLELVPDNYTHPFLVIADQMAISHPEHPLLIVDLSEKSCREFRAIPSQLQSVENNLSIANMDFEEFAEAVDADGIFRGFPRS